MKLRHTIKADQFDIETLETIFETASKMESCERILARREMMEKILKHKSVALLFWEPSSRTWMSFYEAIGRLGGRPIPVINAGVFSSAAKGESLQDTIITTSQYADAIVMRHPEKGSAQIAAETSDNRKLGIPIINAGDGNNEHPTQMILDLYTIWQKKGNELKKGNLTIGFAGDLEHSRVFHSDAIALSQYGVNFVFISTISNNIPDWIISVLRQRGCCWEKTTEIEKFAPEIDVWNFTRLQSERMAKSAAIFPFYRSYLRRKYEKKFGCTGKLKEKMKPDAIILHPWPRLGELPEETDFDPRAVYIKQIKNGLYVRMALLQLLLNPNAFF